MLTLHNVAAYVLYKFHIEQCISLCYTIDVIEIYILSIIYNRRGSFGISPLMICVYAYKSFHFPYSISKLFYGAFTMAYKKTDKLIKYNNEFNKQAYDRISLMVVKGKKEIIRQKATEQGLSMNEFINKAIDLLLEK